MIPRMGLAHYTVTLNAVGTFGLCDPARRSSHGRVVASADTIIDVVSVVLVHSLSCSCTHCIPNSVREFENLNATGLQTLKCCTVVIHELR